MNESNELIKSTFELYYNKFFISDINLSEDVILDIINVNKMLTVEIQNLYNIFLKDIEPILRNILIHLRKLKDKYKYSAKNDLLTEKEYNFTIKRFNNLFPQKYFEVSNYIEKSNIIEFTSDKSFIDLIYDNLINEINKYISYLKYDFNNNKDNSEKTKSIENLNLYNSAIIENLNHVENILSGISKTLNLIDDKFKYYCIFINNIKDFDIRCIRNLSSKTSCFLGEANKDFVTIASRSIITQKIYYDVIESFYKQLHSDLYDFLENISDYLKQF